MVRCAGERMGGWLERVTGGSLATWHVEHSHAFSGAGGAGSGGGKDLEIYSRVDNGLAWMVAASRVDVWVAHRAPTRSRPPS